MLRASNSVIMSKPDIRACRRQSCLVNAGGPLTQRCASATGEVWPAPAVDYAREIGQEDEDESGDPDKWLWVHCESSREGYRDMELFIGTVGDPGRADRQEIAISGRGAFRRFKDVLARWPGELDRWYAFSAERQHGRARAWLADAGYYGRKGLPPS